jgi:ArsR family transcriptional regulator, arsenate/arsenite/antimonite-responsive transcriptional repressor
MSATASPIDAERTARLFHALADPIRIEVVTLLLGGERCVCELMDELELQQSRLSWHLRTLSDAGIITGRREGRWNYYALNRSAFDDAKELLSLLTPSRRMAVRSTCC